MTTTALIFHVLSYYLIWFLSVLTAANGYTWLSLIVSICVIAVLSFWQRQQIQGKPLLLMFMLIASSGIVIDSGLSYWGLIHFQANPWIFAPPWIIGLWLFFAYLMYACLRPLLSYYVVLSLGSLFGFPIAYLGGAKLGAASFPYGAMSSMVIGVIWAFLLPLISVTFQKLAE